MRAFRNFYLTLILLAFNLSCDDDGGSNQTAEDLTTNDLIAFAQFVKLHSNEFVLSSSGLSFAENDFCTAPTEIRIDQENFDLQPTGCFYPSELSSEQTFFLANYVQNWREPENLMFLGVYFRILPTPKPDLASGTYKLTYDCSLGFCFPNFEAAFYVIDRNGRLEGRLRGVVEEVRVTNENNLITVSFDARFYWGGPNDYYDVSARLACCR